MIQSLSTYAGVLQRQNTVGQLQSQLSKLATEESTGLLANPVLEMGSGITSFYQLQSSAAQQTAVQTAATNVGQRLDTMQTALTGIGSVVSGIASTALAASTAVGGQDGTVLSDQATTSMNQVLGLLNTTYGGQYVFSGNDSANQAVVSSAGSLTAGADTAMSATLAASGNTQLDTGDIAALQASLASSFGSSSSAFVAQQSSTGVKVSIGGGQSLSYNMQANSTPVQNLLTGMAMMYLAKNSTQFTAAGQQQLLTQASSLIQQGQSGMTTATGQLGAQQAQLQSVSDTQQAAATATQAQVAAMDTADPYKTATKLTALQTQIQATYEITSMISQLSFVNYMK